MKSSGMVRRLDNLGRIVIPKEIRKQLGIMEGEPLEIFLNENGQVLLNKTTLFKNLIQLLTKLCESVYEILEIPTLICDKEKILCVAGLSKSKLENSTISNELKALLLEKSNYIASVSTKTKIIKLTDNLDVDIKGELIYPIIIDGFSEGLIILCNIKEELKLEPFDLKILQVLAKIISKIVE